MNVFILGGTGFIGTHTTHTQYFWGHARAYAAVEAPPLVPALTAAQGFLHSRWVCHGGR
ncbi:MAG: hypothetical protein ACOCYU_05685 [Brevefilum sp.]